MASPSKAMVVSCAPSESVRARVYAGADTVLLLFVAVVVLLVPHEIMTGKSQNIRRNDWTALFIFITILPFCNYVSRNSGIR
jgi:hypothetical protein